MLTIRIRRPIQQEDFYWHSGEPWPLTKISEPFSIVSVQADGNECAFICNLLSAPSLRREYEQPASLPPLGVMPVHIWEEKTRNQRIMDLMGAITRYPVANVPAKPEWVDEVRDLLGLPRIAEDPEGTPK